MKICLLTIALAIPYFSIGQDSLKTVQLEDVAIFAVRAPEFAPIAKTDVSKEQIEEVYVGQHPIFLLEKLVPGFYSFSESGSSFANYGQFRLRGIHQERINITLNGVPLNDMIDQGVFFSNFTDITSNFESIQVQRGVGTSSNGVSSYGGSISFESFNPKNKEEFSSLQLGAGSFGTYRGNAQVFTGINDKGWGLMSGFSKLTSDGYKDHTDTDASSFFLTGGYFADKEVFKLTLFTSESENGLGYYTIDQSILESNPTFNNLTSNDKDDFSQHMVQLQYNRFLSDRWSVGVTGYYGGAGGDFSEGTPDVDSVFIENYLSPFQTSFFSINYPLSNDHFGGMLNAHYHLGGLSFNTGIHAYTFQRENREEILPDRADPYYLEQSEKNEASWFGKATYAIGPLTLYGDLQIRNATLNISPDYEWIGTSPEGDITYDWTFVNPRIGFTFDASNDLSFYGSFGRSGREPTKIDLFGGFQLNATNYQRVRNGIDFSEEYVNDLELGTRMTKNDFFLDGNLYFMQFEDEIAPIGEAIAFGFQVRRNIPKSSRRGVELQWGYIPNKIMEFNGNFAYLNTNIERVTLNGLEFHDVEQVLSPDIVANAQFKVNASKKFSFALSGRYLGDQFMELTNSNELTVPSSFVSDIRMEAKLAPTVRLSGSINNLFDHAYYTYGLPSDVDFSGTIEPGFYAQPERNFFLSLDFEF